MIRHSALPETQPAECRDCGTAIHSGDTCVECWRDWRDLCAARDREWWVPA